jgi:beta-lactamase regulating signal transducer with metallopeptidase domain
MIIPLVIIPVQSNFILNNSLEKLTFTSGQVSQQITTVENTPSPYTFQNVLIALFIIVSSVLMIRFTLNIFRIIRKIIKSKKVENLRSSFVLVQEKTLPYSFFKYIFVNQSDFENGKIEKELLMHEEAHCLQYHSVDLILLELITIFFWFNPAIWLFKKAILLNHEYYADNTVLTNSDSINYYQLLVNLVVQNNTYYLVSNFKYSFIKNRLIMLTTQSEPSNNAIFRKIPAILLFLFLGISLTFSQDNSLPSNISNLDNEWLTYILQKHKIDLKKFNYINAFDMGLNDTINTLWLEMGISDSLTNRNIPFKNAIFIYKDAGQTYRIMTSEYARHDLDNNKIILKNGESACYDLIYKNIMPFQSHSFQECRINTKASWILLTSVK